MYNRYIPQSDGTYRRNPIIQNPQKPQQKQAPPYNPPISPPSTLPRPTEQPVQPHNNENAGSFLKRLLPKNLDTGDLLIIILLLLLAGDDQGEKNSALLTLALYLFM